MFKWGLSFLFIFYGVIATAEDFLPLINDGVHDNQSGAIGLLQEPEKALKDFPLDNAGAIDWVKTLADGSIEPRKGLTGKEKMVAIDLDIIMKNTSTMPFVSFSHKNHTEWLTCSDCHTKIFMPQVGGNFITMASILNGDYCGTCHGKVAFSLYNCARCHKTDGNQSGLR
ncbi:MAG: cytochrome c3 family protein [Chromatiales bacterium]|nr:cytochrome c3 family protein [Chromatiales bacterium]